MATGLLSGLRTSGMTAIAGSRRRRRQATGPGPLVGADLAGRRLDGGWFWSQDMHGVRLRNASARRAHFNGANLSGADLAHADLRKASFDAADLTDASCDGADLTLANLAGATLVTATLVGTDLRAARLPGADLSGADLRGADLRDIHHDECTSFIGALFDHDTRCAPDLDLEARGAVRIESSPR